MVKKILTERKVVFKSTCTAKEVIIKNAIGPRIWRLKKLGLDGSPESQILFCLALYRRNLYNLQIEQDNSELQILHCALNMMYWLFNMKGKL